MCMNLFLHSWTTSQSVGLAVLFLAIWHIDWNWFMMLFYLYDYSLSLFLATWGGAILPSMVKWGDLYLVVVAVMLQYLITEASYICTNVLWWTLYRGFNKFLVKEVGDDLSFMQKFCYATSRYRFHIYKMNYLPVVRLTNVVSRNKKMSIFLVNCKL